MADPPPTRLYIDPPMDQWHVTPRNGRTTPIIATGHQPILWHPGILAKDLAMDAMARHLSCSAIHLVVDHNPLGPLSIDVPIQREQALSSRRVLLETRGGAGQLPPNRLPAISADSVEHAMDAVVVESSPAVQAGLSHIKQAYALVGDQHGLAEQTTAVLGRLKSPYLEQQQATCSTSDLVSDALVDRLLSDPVRAVRLYNRAALAYPDAGVRPLYVGRDVVELPLWAQDLTICTPVYADLGDSRSPQLFSTGPNQHLDLTKPNAHRYLRPRAITLSAIMRSERCDLFIHGSGGGVYDQVTERWWRDWTGQDLAPMAVVSADVVLPFAVPTSTPSAYAKAQWYAHHLPHNVDRYSQANDEVELELRREKRTLLDQMDAYCLKRRRFAAFRRIHAINDELGRRHDELIRAARRQARDQRIGLDNAAITRRRDWCFALYPEDQLRELARQIGLRLSETDDRD